MEALIILINIYVLLYVFYIARLIYGYAKIPTFKSVGAVPKTAFSIVVPFRNEAQNLPKLLDSIKNLDYPLELFELILVDDFSDDNSQSLVYKWRMENGFHLTMIESVRMTGSPKKDAILRAIPIAVSEWIVTTDADCVLPVQWLRRLNDYIVEHDVSMIAGPVVYDAKWHFLHQFQQADLMSLQGATIGSFGIGKAFMCNGANLAYKKQLFSELNGFKGNSQTASGDDVFLLQKAVVKHPRQVHYLKSKSAIVKTSPARSWRSLFFQRVRWASKAKTYESEFGEALALVVFLGNLSLIIAVVLFVVDVLDYRNLIVLVGLKLIADWTLMYKTNSFLRSGRFFFPIFSSVLYPVFSVVVAVYSLFGKYQWKGRTFK